MGEGGSQSRDLRESSERRDRKQEQEQERRESPLFYPGKPLRLDANYYDDDRDVMVMFNAMTGWK